MKNERLLDALEKRDEELIAEAAPGNKPPKKKNSVVWMKWGTMAACALLIVGVAIPYINKYGGQAEEPETESFAPGCLWYFSSDCGTQQTLCWCSLGH